MSLGESILPSRMGRDFRWLWSSVTVANVADGILLAAGPLIVTSVTTAPMAVASAVFAQRLPWMLFGVVAGALIDRADRRRLVAVADACRAVALLSLAVATVTGHLSLPVIYATMFAIGTAETLADNASASLVADVVPSPELGVANSRLLGAYVVANQLAGPPIGAFLFGVGHAVPFGTNATLFLLAGVLVYRMDRPANHVPREAAALSSQITQGVRWLWAHPAVRTLTVLVTVFNVTFGAAYSIWVLYALERLGVGEFGFGMLMAATAVGGLLASASFERLEHRFSYAQLLRAGLLFETSSHLVLALTSSAAVAAAVMTVFGAHAVTWGTLANTIRHRAVPPNLQGRVTSVHMIGGVGAIAVGSLIGGAIAQHWGLLATFWFAFAGAAVTTVLVWPSIAHVADAGAVPPPDPPEAY